MADAFEWTEFSEQLEYLKERGIDRFTVEKLGLEVKTATWLNDHGIKRSGLSRGIVWQLKDLRGEYTGKIGARVFYNKSVRSPKSQPKFLPPKGEVPGLYYSPLCDWNKLKYGQRIYVCESYLKADVCAMLGFHAVGVSGCRGWSYQKQLNYDFQDLPWREQGLKPIVCMDTDVGPHNPLLYDAACRFNAEMTARCGVSAKILILPGADKMGLDDYFVEHGKKATVEFLKSKYEHLPNELEDNLKIMATKVCLVRDIARFVEIDTGIIMTRGDFENVIYADWEVWTENAKGDPALVSVPKRYTRWGDRTKVHKMVYRPGGERIKDGEFYNLWEGMGCEPMAADASFFTSWVEAVFPPEEADYFLDWWGWQLQNLGGKLTTALVVVGTPGIGKGWITAIMEGIFGVKNISKIPISVLAKDFNADVAAKQLMIVEETDELSKNTQTIYNKLKDLITSTTIRLEKKGVDAYLIENTVNCFLTGNQIGIFSLDSDDRRMAVLEAQEDGPENIVNDQAYWDPRWKWLYEGGGASAVYGFLLNRDISDFNPHGQAPDTKSKRDMIEMGKTPIDLWLSNIKADPEDMLAIGDNKIDGCLMSAKEFCWLYNEGRKQMHELEQAEVTTMNRALKNARFDTFPTRIKPKGGYATWYFQIRLLPVQCDSNASLINNRKFWNELQASVGTQVAEKGPDGSSDKY